MNVVKEDIDQLNAILKVEISKDDYLPKVDDAIRNYRKTIELKGFRKGKVPTGIIKKMYGNGILLEELNKIVSESTSKYLEEEKIEILGRPIPKNDENVNVDIQNPDDYVFEYELGMTPSFELKALDETTKVERQVIKIEDSILNDEIDRMRMQFGTMTYPEDAIQENDILTFDISEIENGEIKEGGIQNSTPVNLSMLKDGKVKDDIVKLKIGDTIDVNPFELIDRDEASIKKANSWSRRRNGSKCN